MFIIFLKFATNRAMAGQFMDDHKIWLKQGFDDGAFVLAGSILPQEGGAILAHGVTRSELEKRINADPFVVHDVVVAQITEIAPSLTNEPLSFLKGATS